MEKGLDLDIPNEAEFGRRVEEIHFPPISGSEIISEPKCMTSIEQNDIFAQNQSELNEISMLNDSRSTYFQKIDIVHIFALYYHPSVWLIGFTGNFLIILILSKAKSMSPCRTSNLQNINISPDTLCLLAISAVDMVTLTLSVAYVYCHYFCKVYKSKLLMNMFLILFQSEQGTSCFSIWTECYMSIVRSCAIIYPHRAKLISSYMRTKAILITLALIAAFYKLSTSLCRLSPAILATTLQFFIESQYCLNITKIETYTEAIVRLFLPFCIIVTTTAIISISISKTRRKFEYQEGVMKLKIREEIPVERKASNLKSNVNKDEALLKLTSSSSTQKIAIKEKTLSIDPAEKKVQASSRADVVFHENHEGNRAKLDSRSSKGDSSPSIKDSIFSPSPPMKRKEGLKVESQIEKIFKIEQGETKTDPPSTNRPASISKLSDSGSRKKSIQERCKPTSPLKITFILIGKNLAFMVFTSIYITLDALQLLGVISKKDWNLTFRLAYMLSSLDLAAGFFICMAAGRKFRNEAYRYFRFLSRYCIREDVPNLRKSSIPLSIQVSTTLRYFPKASNDSCSKSSKV